MLVFTYTASTLPLFFMQIIMPIKYLTLKKIMEMKEKDSCERQYHYICPNIRLFCATSDAKFCKNTFTSPSKAKQNSLEISNWSHMTACISFETLLELH